MTHSSEATSAAYLAGELADGDSKDFEQHLLECDDCWADLDEARRGLTAVESLRELAPSHLRAAVRHGTPARGSGRSHRVALALAAGVAVVAGIGAGVVLALRPSEPSVIAAAVAGYIDDELPGARMPKAPPPDLTSLRLADIGAGAGRIEGVTVTAYAYRDPTGRRLMVYVGTTAFPMPRRAHMFHGPDGPWMTHTGGVMLLASRTPHTVLIVGEDDELVHDAAVALDVM
ncbi:MAG TPA: anti-sigma factor [Actinomycetota bacterium]|nr:anti-sigma factor [Actinomycetota bacterium]